MSYLRIWIYPVREYTLDEYRRDSIMPAWVGEEYESDLFAWISFCRSAQVIAERSFPKGAYIYLAMLRTEPASLQISQISWDGRTFQHRWTIYITRTKRPPGVLRLPIVPFLNGEIYLDEVPPASSAYYRYLNREGQRLSCIALLDPDYTEPVQSSSLDEIWLATMNWAAGQEPRGLGI